MYIEILVCCLKLPSVSGSWGGADNGAAGGAAGGVQAFASLWARPVISPVYMTPYYFPKITLRDTVYLSLIRHSKRLKNNC